ncbi:MAG TPA: acetylornithine deacetylase/succinyl-diaminopimelate desuccinylase family protein [Thermoanaerobaculia bacterium]|nr:acetylornithine deacetylase/succinyl-diaminopimelate desuccinylase family protein [Thermoanaerobaculia bacterium]
MIAHGRRLVSASRDAVLREVEAARDELAELTASLVRVPTINPPGRDYRECAERVGGWLGARGFEVDHVAAEGRREHTEKHPRWNVVALRSGAAPRPLVHLNGHLDVVPVGEGWTIDPFAGAIKDGRVWGRGACDMKGGLAAAMMAAEALRRAGVRLGGSIEISGTADEESGGFAGVAHLARIGRISAQRVDHVIIPEPLGVDRICLGHRGVYWLRVVAHGRIGHGSMPHLGASAIDAMACFLERVRVELGPRLAARITATPVEPEGSRRASINVNTIEGGQSGEPVQTPCVADHCEAVLDRRFLLEEDAREVRAELEALIDEVSAIDERWRFELIDEMLVEPVATPATDRLVGVLQGAVKEVLGRSAVLNASPGTYDHKHATRIGGIESCVAYGPGRLELAHQPDEWVGIDELVASAQVMALALLELVGPAAPACGLAAHE